MAPIQNHEPTRQLIDARQFIWWHRLRSHGRWMFVGVLGAVVAPLVTVLLHVLLICVVYGPTPRLFISVSVIWLVLAPVYALLFAWTWWYMERRYAATRAHRCPWCGHRRPIVSTANGPTSPTYRCPECGNLHQSC